MRKLDLGTPSEELVDGYLSEIAKAYGVPFTSTFFKNQPEVLLSVISAIISHSNFQKKDAEEEGTEEGRAEKTDGNTVTPSEKTTKEDGGAGSEPKLPSPPALVDEFELLSQRFAALKKR